MCSNNSEISKKVSKLNSSKHVIDFEDDAESIKTQVVESELQFPNNVKKPASTSPKLRTNSIGTYID